MFEFGFSRHERVLRRDRRVLDLVLGRRGALERRQRRACRCRRSGAPRRSAASASVATTAPRRDPDPRLESAATSRSSAHSFSDPRSRRGVDLDSPRLGRGDPRAAPAPASDRAPPPGGAAQAQLPLRGRPRSPSSAASPSAPATAGRRRRPSSAQASSERRAARPTRSRSRRTSRRPRTSTTRVPILMYHAISPPPPGAALPGLFVPEAEFEQQMKWLEDNGYHGVTRPDLRRLATTASRSPRTRSSSPSTTAAQTVRRRRPMLGRSAGPAAQPRARAPRGQLPPSGAPATPDTGGSCREEPPRPAQAGVDPTTAATSTPVLRRSSGPRIDWLPGAYRTADGGGGRRLPAATTRAWRPMFHDLYRSLDGIHFDVADAARPRRPRASRSATSASAARRAAPRPGRPT